MTCFCLNHKLIQIHILHLMRVRVDSIQLWENWVRARADLIPYLQNSTWLIVDAIIFGKVRYMSHDSSSGKVTSMLCELWCTLHRDLCWLVVEYTCDTCSTSFTNIPICYTVYLSLSSRLKHRDIYLEMTRLCWSTWYRGISLGLFKQGFLNIWQVRAKKGSSLHYWRQCTEVKL